MSQGSSHGRHRVALLVGNGSNPLEIDIALELFGMTRRELDVDWYDFVACAAEPSVTTRDALFTMSVPGTLDDVAAADTVIAPNRPDPLVPFAPEVLDAIRAAALRG